MGKRGPISMDALMLTETGLTAVTPRPDAPYDLDDRESEVWRSIIDSTPADHFIPANYHLLTQLCRHVVEARRTAATIKAYRKRKDFNYKVYGDLLKQQQAETQTITRLLRSMRLTQQSTLNQHIKLQRIQTISNDEEKW